MCVHNHKYLYGSPSALFTFYYDIASESDVVEPGDDNIMPLLCFPVAARAKLRCRRRLSSFISKPFVCFRGLSDIVRKNDKINIDGVSRKSPLSRWLG